MKEGRQGQGGETHEILARPSTPTLGLFRFHLRCLGIDGRLPSAYGETVRSKTTHDQPTGTGEKKRNRNPPLHKVDEGRVCRLPRFGVRKILLRNWTDRQIVFLLIELTRAPGVDAGASAGEGDLSVVENLLGDFLEPLRSRTMDQILPFRSVSKRNDRPPCCAWAICANLALPTPEARHHRRRPKLARRPGPGARRVQRCPWTSASWLGWPPGCPPSTARNVSTDIASTRK